MIKGKSQLESRYICRYIDIYVTNGCLDNDRENARLCISPL